MKNLEDFYPLSPTQQGILFHSLYAPHSAVYCEIFSCQMQGKLNIPAFKQAWEQLLERHPILRTSFIWEGLKEPAQIVHKQVKLLWNQEDWQSIESITQQKRMETFLAAEQQRGFNIYQAPLMRLTLIQLAENNYQFVWSHHHLLLDGWSSSLLMDEVFTFYRAFSQNQNLDLKKPRAYRDYIAWLQQQDICESEAFWRRYLQQFNATTPLSVDETSSNLSDKQKEYQQQYIKLSTAETLTLQSFARQQQLTLNTLIQGTWAILLSRYSKENDVVFGSVVSGRGGLAGTESMVGVLINTLPVRVRVNSEESLVSWLKQLQIQQNETRKYEQCPLIKVQKCSDIPSGQPLFESIVNFHNYPTDFCKLYQVSNLKISNVRSFIHPHYPLTLSVKVDSELLLEIFYESHRFESNTIARMLGHFRTLLLGMTAKEQQRVKDLPLLTAQEHYQLLLDWNNTQVDYPQKCIYELFEAQVEKTPDAVAAVFENEELTYGELNARANQLAHYLQKLGVKSEVLVGICVERSLNMLIGLLAILKAGGAYIPLDPSYPKERLAFILEDAQAPVLLTQTSLLEVIPQNKSQVVCLDAHWQKIAQQSQENLFSELTTDNLAYVIYTSGSTGKPKGVQIPHSALSNFLYSMQQRPGLTQNDTLLAVTTYSFDIAALELFLPIIVGGSLVIASREIASDGMQLSAKLADSKATVIQATPATWQLLLTAGWSGNHQLKILCGGEALPGYLANKLLHRCASLWNMYGPTETTIWSAASEVKTDSRIISISNAIANTQFYILDRYNQLVPVGVAGELHIGGDGLARGYFNRPDLTAEKFIPNPFSEKAGRLYKTGDLARYLPNGEIEYIGRIDNQVKVRGFRIELGEIEALLTQHSAVREAVVVVRKDSLDSQRIVAYLVPQNQQTLTISELRSFLESKLPSYMMPTNFVILEALPLTPNGKVDRKALPALDTVLPEFEEKFVAPQTAMEKQLAAIWMEVLALEKLGINDNFFEFGGHSLLATQVISRINKNLDVELPIRRIFELPTIAKLAKSIEEKQLGIKPLPPIERVSRDKEIPLSFAQKRLWFLEQLERGSSTYNMPAAVYLNGYLDIHALEQTFKELLRRQEVLRTSFKKVNGNPIQIIASSVFIAVPIIDLSEISAEKQFVTVQQSILEEAQRPFDLNKSPLLRVNLLRLGEESYVLVLVMHHIISDGWSIGVLIRELSALYAAFRKKQPSPVAELPIQYADFAYWQNQWLQGEVMEKHLSYWKQQLANLPVLELPTEYPRPEIQTFRGSRQHIEFSKELCEEIKVLSRREEVTLFMTLLAAFKTLMHYYAKQDDIVVGTDVANRNFPETENIIGFFVNQLVLRTNLGGNPTFQELLKRVREVTLAAYEHQDMPFDQLVLALKPERDLSRTPLFQSKFVLQNAPTLPLELEGLKLKIVEQIDNGTAKFDLLLTMWENEQGLSGSLEYSTELFNATAIAKFIKDYEIILRAVVAQPNIKFTSIKEILVTADKQRQDAKQEEFKQARSQKFKAFKSQPKPKVINLSPEELITESFLQSGDKLPLVISPKFSDLNLPIWAEKNQEFIINNLFKYGGILFRDFTINQKEDFEQFVSGVCPQLMPYIESSTPRTKLSEKVYTSTEFPAEQTIALHNESSYANTYPMKIWFCCIEPASQGGETPIADVRKVFQRIHPRIRERFQEKGWMLVRNYGNGFGLPWQKVYHTTDKAVMEEYCRNACIEVEWKDDKGLRTRQVRPAITKHPKTGEMVWFNHVVFWHVSSLQTQFREKFFSEFTEEDLPYNTFYGDGSSIEDSVIAEIREAYQQEMIVYPWQKGDILMLDNMLTAHARNPYSGSRKILTAMGEPFQHYF
ncbi:MULTISPECIES: non-ribosomal peptide synthetase [Nostoc]|uniref:Amino acid adenylation domain-containing protein n=1 Tax=Nostoc paludosum FACHB-159 TaxID=2692908 RepID=A0ABR8K7P1_9NOSO|nr:MULTISPECIES: non-ribosomal peptide synthetase [Nostoc]MBD2677470.1 amino acid adenylation domain-containing protein [Nostoc sp. FACHB-857]MBD2734137.1 amino acid adenylation domain-containing protein [Nostoc paludosum FACHB-159]